MSKTEVVNPNVGNFIESIRDIGYSFEVAVADLIDNSITAGCTELKLLIVPQPEFMFSMIDNGVGMTELELVEAMRLASRNPNDIRDKTDLGRFGLGLKTASFSQCRKLTVVTKKDGVIFSRQWDLDFISEKNAWLLITPDKFDNLPLFDELNNLKSGTLVSWQNLDRCDENNVATIVERTRKHLALVFHRFLEGADQKSLKILINNNAVKAFNPFNLNHPATQQLHQEKVRIFNSDVTIQPFILPHHSKLSQKEYDYYATEDGYIKSQGFYLYRGNRILIYGTWWNLHKTVDAHKLVRIKIDIPNNMDSLWGIDIKKSIARPAEIIKSDLKRIIARVTEMGSKPFTGRGRKIEDKTIIQFWEILPVNDDFRFAANLNHPLYIDLIEDLNSEKRVKLEFYLKGLQAYLPTDAIQFKLQNSPHQLKQETALSEEDIKELTEKLLGAGLDQSYINELLKTEIYKTRKELIQDANK